MVDGSPVDSQGTLGQVSFWNEMRANFSKPFQWIADPKLLLKNLRLLERFRREIVSDNPEALEEYRFEIQREKRVLLSLCLVDVRQMVIDLRAVKASTALPACADKLEQFAKNLEAVQCGSEDAQAVYDLWRILDHEIRTMEAFCSLNESKNMKSVDNPWTQARDSNATITVSDQMLTLFAKDDSIVDRKSLSKDVAGILGCSESAVRLAKAWDYYQTEKARRKQVIKESRGKRWSKSTPDDADD